MWFVFYFSSIKFLFTSTTTTSQIVWEKRHDGSVRGQTCFVSLDGIDISILEPKPFETRWYSHKLHGPGLRYEIGLNIRTGDIVWSFGGYPCGTYPDLSLAREAFVLALSDNEKAMGDKGYKDPLFVTPTHNNSVQHKRIMARHETVNKKLRQFRILKYAFRHERQTHPMVFAAVANLTQLNIENGEPLYSVL